MLRVFSTNVLDKQSCENCVSKKISMNLLGKDVIEFVLEDKKNTLTKLPEGFIFEMETDGLHVKRTSVARKNFEKLFYHKITGTYRSLIKSAIGGLLKDYIKNLLITGSGYRSSYDKQSHSLDIFVGYANNVKYFLKPTVTVTLASNGTVITLSSYNKQHVTQDAANIIKIKKPNTYSGSGIHDRAKVFVRKEVKKT